MIWNVERLSFSFLLAGMQSFIEIGMFGTAIAVFLLLHEMGLCSIVLEKVEFHSVLSQAKPVDQVIAQTETAKITVPHSCFHYLARLQAFKPFHNIFETTAGRSCLKVPIATKRSGLIQRATGVVTQQTPSTASQFHRVDQLSASPSVRH